MFKTGQPSPEKSKREQLIEELGKTEPIFESIVEFSHWVDEQLTKLEADNQQFFTSKSMRSFFKRG